MLDLSKLRVRPHSHHAKKRVARGTSSGHGKTAGRGTKGQKSRSGGVKRPGFEGGQTPIYRRLPKHRGFKNLLFRRDYTIINLGDLSQELPEVMGPLEFVQSGYATEGAHIKILGNGELGRPLKISAHKFSQSALKKLQGAGGTATVLAEK